VTEFLVGITLSILSVTATFALLNAEWNRTQCAYLTFEAAHARMIGLPRRPSLRIQVEENSAGVRGQGSCGDAREQVELPWLEHPT